MKGKCCSGTSVYYEVKSSNLTLVKSTCTSKSYCLAVWETQKWDDWSRWGYYFLCAKGYDVYDCQDGIMHLKLGTLIFVNIT